MKNDDLVTVVVKGLAYGGQAIATVDGKVLFIDGGLPGDELEVRITKAKGNFAEGKVERILKTNRLKSPCRYSDECGGCDWLELPYPVQLEWKETFISDALRRVGGLQDTPKIEMHPADSQFFYRNRIQLRGQVLAGGKVKVGFFKKQSRDHVAVSSCQIAESKLLPIIAYLDALTLEGVKEQKFRLELQVLPTQEEASKKCVLAVLFPVETWSPANKEKKALQPLLKKLELHELVFTATFAYDVSEEAIAFEEDKGIKYLTIPGIFQQVNIKGNHQMRQWFKERVERSGATRILDLFCGSGNLSLGLASAARSVHGVEYSSAAISCAKKTVVANKITHASYQSMDVKKYLLSLRNSKTKFDLVILDPPRAGLKDLCDLILELGAKTLLIAACDPMTLGRDLKVLTSRYKIEEVHGFDFFPNTFHIETAVHLTHDVIPAGDL